LPLPKHSRCACRRVGFAMPGEGGGGRLGRIYRLDQPLPCRGVPPPFVCFVCSSLSSGRASLRHCRSCASLRFLFSFDWSGLFAVCQSSHSLRPTTHLSPSHLILAPVDNSLRDDDKRTRPRHISYPTWFAVPPGFPEKVVAGFSNPIHQTITTPITTNPPRMTTKA